MQTARKPETPAAAPLSDNHKIALTYQECAASLGISVRYLRTLVRQFKFPYVKMGRSIRFLPDDVKSWLERHRRRAMNVS